MHQLAPLRTVYHGTDADFDEFDLDCCLGAHFGTRQAAHDRLQSTGRLRILYQAYRRDDGRWMVEEHNWANRPRFEHGPFDTEQEADTFVRTAPRNREPLEFEIDVYRPLLLEDLGTWEFEGVMRALCQPELAEVELARERIYREWNRSSQRGWAALKAAVADSGFDCIAYRNQTEDPGELSWIVLDPDRIHRKWTPQLAQRLAQRAQLQDQARDEPQRERMRA